MKNYIKCPRCCSEQNAEQTYCNDCDINMQKYFWDEGKEKEMREEKPKKGTFDKNFFRGKVRDTRRR